MKTFIAILLVALSIQSSAQRSTITPDRNNVVYIGIPNPITVIVEGYNCKDILLTSRHGKLGKDEDGHYDLQVTEPGKDTIEVAVKTKSGNKKIGRHYFRILELPAPVVQLAGKKDGEISKVVVAEQVGLTTIMEGFEFAIKFRIDMFQIIVLRNDQVVFIRKNVNASFDGISKKFFAKLEAGDRLSFVNIHATGPNIITRNLAPIEFLITE